MVKTTDKSDLPWSATFSVIVCCNLSLYKHSIGITWIENIKDHILRSILRALPRLNSFLEHLYEAGEIGLRLDIIMK